MIPEVIFLIGPPGCGKTTYTKNTLLPNGDYTVVSTDDIITKKGTEIGLTYNEAFDYFNFNKIEELFFYDIKSSVNEFKSIIVDRTNLTIKGRNKVLRLLPKEYTKIAYIFDFSDRDKLNKQLLNRELTEGKYIAQSIVDNMIKSYIEPTLGEFDQIVNI